MLFTYCAVHKSIIWRWLMTNTEYIHNHTQQPEISPNQQLVDTHFSTLLLSLFSSREFFTVSSSSKMLPKVQNIPWLKNNQLHKEGTIQNTLAHTCTV